MIFQVLITSGSVWVKHFVPEGGASLVAQMIKNLPAMWERWVQSLGWEDPLEKRMATHSSIRAWRTPWTEKPSCLPPHGPFFACFVSLGGWCRSLHWLPFLPAFQHGVPAGKWRKRRVWSAFPTPASLSAGSPWAGCVLHPCLSLL